MINNKNEAEIEYDYTKSVPMETRNRVIKLSKLKRTKYSLVKVKKSCKAWKYFQHKREPAAVLLVPMPSNQKSNSSFKFFLSSCAVYSCYCARDIVSVVSFIVLSMDLARATI